MSTVPLYDALARWVHPVLMRRLTMALLGAVALTGLALTAGCGGTQATTTPAGPAPTTAPALPKCSEVFKLGQKIDQAKAAGGCLDPDGGVRVVGAHRCNDGRHLWQVDASTGAPAGWGFGDATFTAAKDAASDPGYGKAYEACMS